MLICWFITIFGSLALFVIWIVMNIKRICVLNLGIDGYKGKIRTIPKSDLLSHFLQNDYTVCCDMYWIPVSPGYWMNPVETQMRHAEATSWQRYRSYRAALSCWEACNSVLISASFSLMLRQPRIDPLSHITQHESLMEQILLTVPFFTSSRAHVQLAQMQHISVPPTSLAHVYSAIKIFTLVQSNT